MDGNEPPPQRRGAECMGYGRRFEGSGLGPCGTRTVVPGSGLSFSGSGLRIPGSGFQVPGSGFRVSGFWIRIPGSGFRVPGSGFRVPGSGFRVPGSGFRVQGPGAGSRFRVQVPGPGLGLQCFRVSGFQISRFRSRVLGFRDGVFQCRPRPRVRDGVNNENDLGSTVQGYLVHKKLPSPRTLQ